MDIGTAGTGTDFHTGTGNFCKFGAASIPVPNLPCVFFPPIDIQQALLIVQHTQSVSVPIHPSNKSPVGTSFETDIYIHRKYNKIPGTYMRSILMRDMRHVASVVCFPGA